MYNRYARIMVNKVCVNQCGITCGAKDATQIGDEDGIKAGNRRKIDDFGVPGKCVS